MNSVNRVFLGESVRGFDMPKCFPSACGGTILSPVSLSHALVPSFFSLCPISQLLLRHLLSIGVWQVRWVLGCKAGILLLIGQPSWMPQGPPCFQLPHLLFGVWDSGR